jgi:hypothetical protein
MSRRRGRWLFTHPGLSTHCNRWPIGWLVLRRATRLRRSRRVNRFELWRHVLHARYLRELQERDLFFIDPALLTA